MAENGIEISGEIRFTQDPPKSPLPTPSLLVVQLEDCRRAGAPSIEIGRVELDAHGLYIQGQPLMYSLKVPKFVFGMEYQISAVLNIGWVPDKSKDEWIRSGDYLNDTSHIVCATDQDTTELKYDVEVVHYS